MEVLSPKAWQNVLKILKYLPISKDRGKSAFPRILYRHEAGLRPKRLHDDVTFGVAHRLCHSPM